MCCSTFECHQQPDQFIRTDDCQPIQQAQGAANNDARLDQSVTAPEQCFYGLQARCLWLSTFRWFCTQSDIRSLAYIIPKELPNA